MNKVLLTLLITLSSCKLLYKDIELVQKFENTFKLKITLESNFVEDATFANGSIIDRPAGTWQKIISSDNFCLNYKIPLDKKNGVLQLVTTLKKGECPTLPTKNEIISVKNISQLRVKISTDHIQGKKVRNGIFGLILSYEHNKIKRKLVITLPNKMRSKSYIKSKMIKYSSSGTHRLDKGVRITKDSMKKLRSSLWYGNWKVQEAKDITLCERKNDQCEIIGTSNCDECLYGWEYVVDYNCDGGGSKACSPINCGEKGMPACSRGVLWSGQNMRELCFDDSPGGFCQDDLRVICGEDEFLICI